MTKHIAVLPMLCVAGVATAQLFPFSLLNDAPNGVVNVGDIVTITLNYSPTDPNLVIAGGIFSFTLDQASSANGLAAPGMWLHPGTFTGAGAAVGPDLTGANYGQFPNTNRTNGNVFQYYWTATEPGFARINMLANNPTIGVFGQGGGSVISQRAAATTFTVIPAPATPALAAIGLIAACRRRR